MSGPPGRVSAVVPTLGVSPWLVAALDALRGASGPGAAGTAALGRSARPPHDDVGGAEGTRGPGGVNEVAAGPGADVRTGETREHGAGTEPGGVEETGEGPESGRLPGSGAEGGAGSGGGGLEIVVVWQGPGEPPREVAERADRLLAYPAPLGFAAAVNRGIEAASGELVAVVNDDAVVGPGWIAALAAALAAEPRAASAQGINYLLPPSDTAPGRIAAAPAGTGHPTRPLPDSASPEPTRLDGAGLTWNRWWQAVQIGHGEPVRALGAQPEAGTTASPGPDGRLGTSLREVFGVSATAALYRRAALDEVTAARENRRDARGGAGEPADAQAGGRRGGPFDERLVSYYEDVELACRLRGAGWTALSVPTATVHHAGSATADRVGGRTRLVTANRWLVAAWLLGRRFPLAKPRMAVRDLADLARALGRGNLATAAGIAAGWGRALLRLPRWARLGPPAVDRATLRRLSAERQDPGRGAG